MNNEIDNNGNLIFEFNVGDETATLTINNARDLAVHATLGEMLDNTFKNSNSITVTHSTPKAADYEDISEYLIDQYIEVANEEVDGFVISDIDKQHAITKLSKVFLKDAIKR